jgi:hypothetical protein
MHKDAYGVRPRGIDTSTWTEADFLKEFGYLNIVIEREAIQRRADEEKAAHDFEMRMLGLLQSGAKDREMAMRWVHEAEGSGGDDEYLCFLLGLPYRYFVVDTATV